MKKRSGKILAGISVAVMALALAGCGKKPATTVELQTDEYVYIPSIENYNFKKAFDKGSTNPLYFTKDYAGYMEYNYGEDDELTQTLFHEEDRKTGEEVSFALELGENEYPTDFFKAGDEYESIFCTYNYENGNQSYVLKKFSKTGECVSSVDINEVISEAGTMYVGDLAVGKNGEIYIAADTNILIISSDGKKLGKIETQNWVSSMVSVEDGSVYFVSSDPEGYNLYKINPDTYKEEKIAIEGGEKIGSHGSYLIMDGGNGKLFISDSDYAYIYDTVGKTLERLWNWMDIDVFDAYPTNIMMNDDGTYLVANPVYATEQSDSYLEMITLKRELAKDQPAKATLVMGTMYIDDDVKKQVSFFNKNSQDYKIVIKEYLNTYEYDYQTAYDVLTTDVASGSIDIAIMSDYPSELITKGAYVDLTPYLEKSEKINKDDLFMNVFDSCKIGDGMYFISPRFRVDTIYGNSKYFPNDTWELKDLVEIIKANPDKEIVPYASSLYILSLFLNSSSEFIDWENSTCSFTGDDFKDLLQVAASFDEEPKYSDDYDEWELMQSESIILTGLSLMDTDYISLYDKLFNGEGKIIGYPGEFKNKISFNNYVSISKKSKYQDVAWEFVESLFSDNYYNNSYSYMGFPAKKSVFQKEMENLISQRGEGSSTWGNGKMEITLDPPTKETIDLVTSVIESAEKSSNFDQKIVDIITEEAEPFLKGQKTVDEVCDIIQSRVSIYLQEMK